MEEAITLVKETRTTDVPPVEEGALARVSPRGEDRGRCPTGVMVAR
jgi:hypothetical protein